MAVKILLHIKKYSKPTVACVIVGLFFQLAYAQPDIELVQSNGKFTGISLSAKGTSCNSISDKCLNVHLAGQPSPILGKWSKSDGKLVFWPVWPFTSGLNYELLENGRSVAAFSIPSTLSHANLTLSVFPSSDTLPANLLKMYFQFSEAMQQVRSEKYVFILNQKGDTLQEVFMDLHPELWNDLEDRLTLWIDPGRVKRDLIRNQKLGAPLDEGKTYQLIVSFKWKSQNGATLSTDFTKNIFISNEDRVKPNLQKWSLDIPTANTKNPLIIDFKESLDYALLQDCISINRHGEDFNGEYQLVREERGLIFTPEEKWKIGTYQIQVESRLEDLAGNNMNRLFDVDLSQSDSSSTTLSIFTHEFTIE